MSKRSAHIIIPAASRLNKVLEFRDNFFPASVARIVNAILVMNFFSAVKAENNIAHFAVGKVYNAFVNKHSVGGESKAKVLALFFLDAARVFDELFDHLKVHKRFAAEKVNLEIASRTRIFDEKVEGALSDLKAHKGAFAVILSLAGETVRTVKVTGMRNVQTKSLYYPRGFRFESACHRFELIFCKKLVIFGKLTDLAITFLDVRYGNIGILCRHFVNDVGFVIVFEHRNYVISEFVDNVNRARTYVENDV